MFDLIRPTNQPANILTHISLFLCIACIFSRKEFLLGLVGIYCTSFEYYLFFLANLLKFWFAAIRLIFFIGWLMCTALYHFCTMYIIEWIVNLIKPSKSLICLSLNKISFEKKTAIYEKHCSPMGRVQYFRCRSLPSLRASLMRRRLSNGLLDRSNNYVILAYIPVPLKKKKHPFFFP